MAKSNFDQLLQRYLEGNVSEQEKIKIEAWLDEAKTNDNDLNLNAEDQEKIFQRITNTISQTNTTPQTNRNPIGILRIAAAFLLLVAASALLWFYVSKEDNLQVPETATEKMILNDGTLVWLRKESKLFYYERPGDTNRYARLIGQGLFEVAKDPKRPFIITAGNFNLKVLGTSFNVNAYQDSIELTVLTGLVNISSHVDQEGQNISANQKIVYHPTKNNKPITITPDEVQDLIANTDYNMHFANNTLEEVVKKIATKFDVNITIKEKNMHACKLTADFTDHSLQSTLETIAEILEINYSIAGNQVVIKDGKCK